MYCICMYMINHNHVKTINTFSGHPNKVTSFCNDGAACKRSGPALRAVFYCTSGSYRSPRDGGTETTKHIATSHTMHVATSPVGLSAPGDASPLIPETVCQRDRLRKTPQGLRECGNRVGIQWRQIPLTGNQALLPATMSAPDDTTLTMS